MSQNEPGGIWPPYEVFYLESMLFCTTSALSSVAELQDNLEHGAAQGPDTVGWNATASAILNSTHNIALQGAALSRYFWPARNREPHSSRAKQLRSGLNVLDNSPLRERALRNEMEHFDERLDRFCQTTAVGYILPQYVGPFLEESEVPRHLFRAYYIDQGVFEVLGKRYEMQPIADEIGAIHDRLLACREVGGRISAPGVE